MQRRHFLQTGSALGAMGLVSGCATMGGGSGPKVVPSGVSEVAKLQANEKFVYLRP